jgi:hypothetical protein
MDIGALRGFEDLNSLNLGSCYQLGDQELGMIIEAHANLIELKLYGCKKLSDLCFENMGRKMAKMQILDVSKTSITDRGLIDLGARCKALHTLAANHCLGLSEFGVRGFLKNGFEMSHLSLKESLIEDAAIHSIEKDFPKVEIGF